MPNEPLQTPASAPGDRREPQDAACALLLLLDDGPADHAALALARAVEAAVGQPPQVHRGAMRHQTGADVQAAATGVATATATATVVAADPARLLSWLAAQGTWQGGPLSAFGAPPTAEQAAALVAGGVSGCWPPAAAGPEWLAAALALDSARWHAAQQLRREAASSQAQLDDRKWIERAKGVLMDARGIGEREAFELLRGAAMHASLRLGQLSRAVTESAQWADALNRAGQLRMLSQRLVSLAAQGCDAQAARRARAERDEAVRRIDDILQHLRTLAVQAGKVPDDDVQKGVQGVPWQPLLERTAAACAALQEALAARWTVAMLPAADEHAEAMLARAEELLVGLEAASGRRALHIVNLCGRQRMRVQRVAKQALLAHLLADAGRHAGLPPLLDEFEAVIRELEQAPLSTPEIRTALNEARDEWVRLLRGLHGLARPEGRATLVQASDALLGLFERLTAAYERSLQVLMA